MGPGPSATCLSALPATISSTIVVRRSSSVFAAAVVNDAVAVAFSGPLVVDIWSGKAVLTVVADVHLPNLGEYTDVVAAEWGESKVTVLASLLACAKQLCCLSEEAVVEMRNRRQTIKPALLTHRGIGEQIEQL